MGERIGKGEGYSSRGPRVPSYATATEDIPYPVYTTL